jgi:hypothetical protein
MSMQAEYIYVFARIVVSDPHIFLQLMAATAASQSKAESVLYDALLDQWWNTVCECTLGTGDVSHL